MIGKELALDILAIRTRCLGPLKSNQLMIWILFFWLLVMEERYEWPAKSVAQTLAEAGCLLKKRLAVGKKTPVFAVLTNGTDFRFFAIDTDGVVYASDKEVLKVGNDGTYNSTTS